MRLIPYLLILLTLSCSSTETKETKKNDVLIETENSIATPEIGYQEFKKSVLVHKKGLKGKSKKVISDYLYKLISQSISGYWKGTKWDFNGVTRKPTEGNIACGYFVTNTLTDLGFKIKRIKLAQAVSSKMIQTLCTDIRHFNKFEKLEHYLKQQPDNTVWIVGLDFHTGYLLKDSTGIYFLHSNYIDRKGVVKEKIGNSKALLSNKTFMTGNLTANSTLLNKWVKG